MNKYVHLSLSKKETIVKFEVVQYATLPFITFVLDDYVPASGCTASLYIEKPDGTKIYNACSVADNLVTYEPTTQSFAVLGINNAQLQLVEPNGTGVSFLMYIEVTKNIIDESAIESQDEFTALEEALQTVSQYDTRITDNTNRISVIEPLANNAVLHNDTNGAVSLNGNLTINKVEPTINFTNSETTSNSRIVAFPANNLGNNLVMSSGGNTVIGGGEYAISRYNDSLIGDTSEELYLGSDINVYIETNGQTIANAKRWTFNSSGQLVSPTNSVFSLGDTTTAAASIWGNSSNKVGVSITNNQEEKRYAILARPDRFRLYNYTDSSIVWDILPPTVIASGGNMGQDTASVPHNVWTVVGSWTFDPGTYLINIVVPFTANANGMRLINFNTESASSGGGWLNNANDQAVPTGATISVISTIVRTTTSKTYYLNANQTSGGTLNCTPRWSCVKIG